MSALNTDDLLFEEKPLHSPSLEEVKEVLAQGLPSNFKDVTVEIVDCPNLQHAPFHLAGSGLGGSPHLIEIGGAPYLLPLVNRSKIYNIKEICKKSYQNETKEILAMGAGAGPTNFRNVNCEGIYNMKISTNDSVINESHISRVEGQEEKCVLEKLPNSETKLALLANLFVSEGKPGKVLFVSCKKRTGPNDFICSIRTSLAEHYGDKCVGLGGVFLLKSGKAKQHVMRDFSTTPIFTETELNNWLKFYEMPAPLIAVGTLVTNECDLDLRLQHFHSFSKSNWGGHYHIDTTPDIVEYEGYFNIGGKIVRVDKPVDTHKFGRD